MLELGCFIGLLSPPKPWRRMGPCTRYKNVCFRMCRLCHSTSLLALLTFSSLSPNLLLTSSPRVSASRNRGDVPRERGAHGHVYSETTFKHLRLLISLSHCGHRSGAGSQAFVISSRHFLEGIKRGLHAKRFITLPSGTATGPAFVCLSCWPRILLEYHSQ
jgi:hypothetical protein